MTKYFKDQKVVVAILQTKGNSETPDTTTVTVTDKDESGNISRAKGASVPSAESGYAVNCMFYDTSAKKAYLNTGTTSSCTFTEIQVGEITAADLGTDSVDSDEIATDAVDSDEIATDAVDSDEIATDAVDSDEIATDAVGTDEIDDGSIEEADVDPNLITDLVTVALMGTVAEFTFPFDVVVNSTQIPAFAKIEDGGVFANLADSAGEAGYTGAFQLFPDTEVENDAAYFGAVAPFGILSMNVSVTVAIYNADSITWEYWNGSAWVALTIIYDETDTTAQDGLRPFQQDGEIIFSAPTDWAQTTVDGQAGFWVRARCNATVDITTIPLLADEHALVSSPTASEVPATGTIGRSRLSWVTTSGANNDTKVILCNLTKGTCSAITTLTKALRANEVANWDVICDAGDQIALYVTQEDGTTEYADGMMEMNVLKS